MSKEKKSHKGRKIFFGLIVLGSAAAVGYIIEKRNQPVEDPWAEAYWDDVAVEEQAADLRAKAEELAED